MSKVSPDAYVSGMSAGGGLEVAEGAVAAFCVVKPGSTLKIGRNSIVVHVCVEAGDVVIGDNCLVIGTNIRLQGKSFSLGDDSVLKNCVVNGENTSRAIALGRGALWYETSLFVADGDVQGEDLRRCSIGADSTVVCSAALTLTGGDVIRIGDRFTMAQLSDAGILKDVDAIATQLMDPAQIRSSSRSYSYSPSIGLAVTMVDTQHKPPHRMVFGDDVIVRGTWRITCSGDFSMGTGSRLWSVASPVNVNRHNISIGANALVGRSPGARDLTVMFSTPGGGRRRDLIVGEGGAIATSSCEFGKYLATITVPPGNKVL